ncbi:ornithine--oxo-acid transaminase [Hydrogenophaga sp. 5NK40-0174]|uniref:ornithine--oxo-acid transaminase n=1 Tax=Hydrogenophaga sp. 5NK40-0174 TaxID=3127649 RepID=UPI00310A03AC
MLTGIEVEGSIIAEELTYGATNYASLPVVLTKGKGTEVWDIRGNRFLDFMSAYSAANLGHCHPRIVQVVSEQAARLGVVSRAFHHDRLGAFLKRACDATGMDKALPMNSGAEAVETAIKAARKWAYEVKGVKPGRAEIVCCNRNFHGRTMGMISMSSSTQNRSGFGPYLRGFLHVPFGDVDALENAITNNTAAFVVEPIQGEAGVVLPPPEYLHKCEEICRRNNVLLIVDEIQTGLGRAGHMLACNAQGVKPDAVCLGKALGGGVVPVSLFLARQEVMDVFQPGDHGSTFGGYPIAAAVGIEALQIVEDESLCERSMRVGKSLKSRLEEIRADSIVEVRGQGLMIGLEVKGGRNPAKRLALALMSNGILCKDVNQTTLRLAPPLNVHVDHVEEFLNVFAEEVAKLESS